MILLGKLTVPCIGDFAKMISSTRSTKDVDSLAEKFGVSNLVRDRVLVVVQSFLIETVVIDYGILCMHHHREGEADENHSDFCCYFHKQKYLNSEGFKAKGLGL